jgi:hypothetical protein
MGTLLHRLLEKGNKQDHLDCVEKWLLPRIQRIVKQTCGLLEIAVIEGEIQFEDKVLEPLYPVVEVFVYVATECRIPLTLKDDKSNPLVVDIEQIAQSLWVYGRTNTVLSTYEFICATQLLVLAWIEVDDKMRQKLCDGLADTDPCFVQWWDVCCMMLKCWRSKGVVVWTKSPSMPQCDVDVHRCTVVRLMNLLRGRFVLWCC